jgi:hypothetical protein
VNLLRRHYLIAFVLVGLVSTLASPTSASQIRAVSTADEAFLEDLEHRSFQYFWEQADPNTGLVADRARMDGSPLDENHHNVGSIASTGFGLTALCIAADGVGSNERRLLNALATHLASLPIMRTNNTVGFITG